MVAPQPKSKFANATPETTGKPLKDVYGQWFTSQIADTPEQVEQAYRLRYDVYCVETGFESPEDNPGGLETDEFDGHSEQALLTYVPTGDIAGAIRVVLPQSGMPGSGLPAHIICPEHSASGALGPIDRTGELSRFAVSARFRKRESDTLYPGMESKTQDPRRVLPHIALGLIQTAYKITQRHDLTHLCAIIDPLLLRMVRRLGLEFESVGGLVEYHGLRQPVCVEIEKLAENMRSVRPDIWEVVRRMD